MVKIYLVHGWGGSPSAEGWFGWLREECEKRDIDLIIPEMPDTGKPVIERWVSKLNEVVGMNNFDDPLYFVGHSIGCQAIMRYLDGNNKINVNGLVFVAPWMRLDSKTIEEEGEEVYNIARPWTEIPIDFENVSSYTNNVLCIFSSNDPYVSLDDGDLFKDKLNAEIVVKESEGHFNETTKIDEIIKFIDKIEIIDGRKNGN